MTGVDFDSAVAGARVTQHLHCLFNHIIMLFRKHSLVCICSCAQERRMPVVKRSLRICFAAAPHVCRVNA